MDLRLDGRVALVTGGSRGIGKAIASAFADSGAAVMIASRKQAGLEAAAAEIGGDISWHVANVADPASASDTVTATLERFGRLDILVNNAGTNPYLGPLMGITQAQMEKTVQVNQHSIVTWTQAAWHRWLQQHGGTVINLASIGGLGVEPGIAYYAVTKAAVIHLTRQLAEELAPGVRVNALAPGFVRTDMARVYWEGREDILARRTALGRIGEPADIASAAVFLASDAAGWITGTTLVADGGDLLASAKPSEP
jgi:NAD(P)-dependent dehydrogenase (short-subunit alcohol dehydrogenase family)